MALHVTIMPFGTVLEQLPMNLSAINMVITPSVDKYLYLGLFDDQVRSNAQFRYSADS